MHHDQVGFILGIKGWFNICKSMNVTYHKQNNKTKYKKKKSHDHLNDEGMVLQIIHHKFMIKALSKVGIKEV